MDIGCLDMGDEYNMAHTIKGSLEVLLGTQRLRGSRQGSEAAKDNFDQELLQDQSVRSQM